MAILETNNKRDCPINLDVSVNLINVSTVSIIEFLYIIKNHVIIMRFPEKIRNNLCQNIETQIKDQTFSI